MGMILLVNLSHYIKNLARDQAFKWPLSCIPGVHVAMQLSYLQLHV